MKTIMTIKASVAGLTREEKYRLLWEMLLSRNPRMAIRLLEQADQKGKG